MATKIAVEVDVKTKDAAAEVDDLKEQLEKLKADHGQAGPQGPPRKSLRERTVEQPEEVGFESELNSLLKELAPRHEAANEKALKRSRR